MNQQPLNPELRVRVLDEARRTRSPTRFAATTRAGVALFTALIVSIGLFVQVGGVRVGPRPLALIVGTALGSSLIALCATWTAISRAGSMLGRPRLFLLLAAIATPVVLFVWKIYYSALFLGMSERWPTRPGLKCFGLTLGTALLPLIALAFERRRTDPTHPKALGAALGGAVGTWAAVMVDLWCPVAYPPHVVLGHVLPILILVLIGAWLGKVVIAIRG